LNAGRDRISVDRRSLVWEEDGRESSVALSATEDLALIINGKADGSARNDAPTQVMSGMLSAMLLPNPRSACVIGLGTGSTAGWLSTIPAMERVDVFEIEPAVVEMSSMYAPVNQDVLRRPNVRIQVGDAREILLASDETYDLIFSEPSNPYRAGIASLYTREFYGVAKNRLRRGGIFAQWVQTYAVDAETIRTVYATMRTAFPHVDTWWTTESDLLLVASLEPITYDADALRARLATSPYREAAHAAWRAETVEGLFSHFVASNAFGALVSRGASLNTDDRTTIEFSFARSLSTSSFGLSQILDAARRSGHSRPERLRGAVDWNRVLEQRAAQGVGDPNDPRVILFGMHGRDSLRSAGAFFARNPWQIHDSGELARVAEALAEVSDERALQFADALRALQPIEADAITARLRLRQRRLAEAAESIERALIAYRTNPWPQMSVMLHSIDTATEIALADRALAPRIYAVLEKPFASLLLEDGRRMRRFAIAAQQSGCSSATLSALADLEPHVPWKRHTLEVRVRCYSGEAKEAAKRDLAKFDAAEPPPLLR
jgi:spermidine synthase